MLKQLFIVMLAVVLFTAQTSFSMLSVVCVPKHTTDSIPFFIKGNFEDDYGVRYTINDTLWTQHPSAKYHIIRCDTTEKYLLVQNDSTNKSDGGLYTRIDYMSFTGMEPFHWGFCLTIYDATTPERAIAAAAADRKNPKKGCGGYPFSRMKR